jgi:hypothetical protein
LLGEEYVPGPPNATTLTQLVLQALNLQCLGRPNYNPKATEEIRDKHDTRYVLPACDPLLQDFFGGLLCFVIVD